MRRNVFVYDNSRQDYLLWIPYRAKLTKPRKGKTIQRGRFAGFTITQVSHGWLNNRKEVLVYADPPELEEL